MIHTFFSTLWSLAIEMSPYLLLGFFIAGFLHVFLPQNVYSHHLSKENFSSVLKSAAFGIPLPLCSCSVVPTAMSLRKEGASKGATVSFLTSTPQTGVDSIAATYSLMGLPFAIIRPIAALSTALVGGILVNKFDKEAAKPAADSELFAEADFPQNGAAYSSFASRIKELFRYGFYQMVLDLSKWLIIGLVIAALITMCVPDQFFTSLSSYPFLSMLLVLLLSMPMYLCATGSIPIALALMLKGLSPGAALVLLMAGPATNAAAMMVIYKVLGKKPSLIYLAVLILGAILFGLGIDYLLPRQWFALTAQYTEACHSNVWMHWVGVVSALLLMLLLLFAFVRNEIYKHKNKQIMMSKQFKVTGMSCNHCRNNVEQHLAKINGVEAINIDLKSGILQVEGEVLNSVVVQCVQNLGYGCNEI